MFIIAGNRTWKGGCFKNKLNAAPAFICIKISTVNSFLRIQRTARNCTSIISYGKIFQRLNYVKIIWRQPSKGDDYTKSKTQTRKFSFLIDHRATRYREIELRIWIFSASSSLNWKHLYILWCFKRLRELVKELKSKFLQ